MLQLLSRCAWLTLVAHTVALVEQSALVARPEQPAHTSAHLPFGSASGLFRLGLR